MLVCTSQNLKHHFFTHCSLEHHDMTDQSACHWCEHDLAAWRCSVPHVSAWSLSADQWSVVTSGPGPMCQLAPPVLITRDNRATMSHRRGHLTRAPTTDTGTHRGSRVIWPHMYTGGSHWEGCSSQTGPDTLARAAPPSLGNCGSLHKTREDDVLMNTRNRPAEIKSEWRVFIHQKSGSYSVYLVSLASNANF